MRKQWGAHKWESLAWGCHLPPDIPRIFPPEPPLKYLPTWLPCNFQALVSILPSGEEEELTAEHLLGVRFLLSQALLKYHLMT